MSLRSPARIPIAILMAALLVASAPPPAAADPRPDTTRVAISISGAASLGAFEGGALAEIVRQLELHNRRHPDRPFVIDAVAGTSAGALSTVILARELYAPTWDVTRSDYPDSSLYYRAWVQDIDLTLLLPLDWKHLEKEPFALRPDVIRDIARRRVGTEVPGMGGGPPLGIAPDTLVFGVTLANVEGLQYNVHFGDRPIPVRFYAESRSFVLSDEGRRLTFLQDPGTTASWWDDVIASAIASAAVPFAFPPVRLDRRDAEYEFIPENLSGEGYQYVDGGFFNNDPIDIVQQYVHRMDRAGGRYHRGLAAPDRKLLSISPDFFQYVEQGESLATTFDYTVADDDAPRVLGQFTKNMLLLAERSIRSAALRDYMERAIAETAEVSDLVLWLYARRDNERRVRELVRAVELSLRLGAETADPGILDAIMESSPEDFTADSLDAVGYTPDLNAAVARRLHPDFVREDARAAARWLRDEASAPYQQLFVDFFDIRGFTPYNTFVMIADDPSFRLAGAAHARFAGFYSEDARAHDFFAGRYYAQRALREALGVSITDPITDADLDAFEARFHAEHGDFETLRDYFPTVDSRVAARKRIEMRAGAYLQYTNVPWWLRVPVMTALNSRLDENLIYMPQWVDLTLLAQWQEIESIAAGLQMDMIGPVFQKKPGWYDAWIRGTGVILQPYIGSELGYKSAQYHYFDVTLAPQLSWYRWLPSPVKVQAQFGARFTFDEFEGHGDGQRWVAGFGFKWTFFYLSAKNFLDGWDISQVTTGDGWDWRFGLVLNAIRLGQNISLVF